MHAPSAAGTQKSPADPAKRCVQPVARGKVYKRRVRQLHSDISILLHHGSDRLSIGASQRKKLKESVVKAI